MISLGELAPSDTAVIREVYDSDNAQELFEMELERALQVRNLYFFKSHFGGIKKIPWTEAPYTETASMPHLNCIYDYLKVGCRTIVIEPTKLGEETAKWISIGNLLHKISLISGCGAFAVGTYVIW